MVLLYIMNKLTVDTFIRVCTGKSGERNENLFGSASLTEQHRVHTAGDMKVPRSTSQSCKARGKKIRSMCDEWILTGT